MRVKAVIIGCGKIAGGFDNVDSNKIRTHAKAYANNNKTNLVGVCDSNIKKAKTFGKKWNVKYITSSVDDLIKDCNPDIVSICTNTEDHYFLAKKLINLGIKNIWMEKPSSENLLKTIKLSRLIEKNKTYFTISYYRRHEKPLSNLNLEIKKIGQVQNIRAIYSKGLKNNGSHILDFLLFYFPNFINIKLIDFDKDNYYPSASFIIKYKNFNIDILSVNYKKFEMFEIDIIGTKGRINLRNGGRNIDIYKLVKNKYYHNYKNLDYKKSINITFDDTFKKILSNILKKNTITNIEAEIRVMKIIDKIENKLK